MPTDYVTRIELDTKLSDAFKLHFTHIEEMFEKRFLQLERNIGAISEHFLGQVKMLAEGVQMQIEAVERFRLENSADHEHYESRLSRLESKRLLGKR